MTNHEAVGSQTKDFVRDIPRRKCTKGMGRVAHPLRVFPIRGNRC
jgi:hypothetical protein